MDKKGSKVTKYSIVAVKVEEMPHEYSIKIEPRIKFDEFPIKKEPRNDFQFEENETLESQEKPGSNDKESYGPLEFDLKLEPQRFFYPMPPKKSRRVLRAKFIDFLKPVVKVFRLNETAIAQLTAPKEKPQATSDIKAANRARKSRGNRWIEPRRLMKNGPYSCDICGSICRSRKSMYEHMRYHHTAQYLFCDLCPKSCKNKSLLSYHMRTHMKFKALICDVCEFKTNYIHHLQTHKLTHGQKTECAICHKPVSVLKKHMEKVHKKVPCKICGNKMSKTNLKSHFRKVHEKNNRCTNVKCNETFGTKLELKRHVLRFHFDGKVFECHCGSVFKNIKVLRVHNYNTHNSEVFTCKVCNLTYKRRSDLVYHFNQKHFESHGRFQAS